MPHARIFEGGKKAVSVRKLWCSGLDAIWPSRYTPALSGAPQGAAIHLF